MADGEWVREQFGRTIRGARRERGLSQGALAALVELNRTSITNIEAGRQGVSVEALLDLAEALQVAPGDLLPTRPSKSEEVLPGRLTRGLRDDEEAWVSQIVRSTARGPRSKRGPAGD